MVVGSASGERPDCLAQYCMTMAMLAAPQPSGCCLIKGTSSHTASLALSRRLSSTETNGGAIMRRIRKNLSNSDDDQDQNCDRENDEDKIMVIDVAGREVCLRFVDTRRELGELIVVQRGHGGLHLPRIHAGRFHGLVSFVG